jgi:uncharacterized protein (DUF488 family)
MSIVYTIGYEGATVEKFVATLVLARIDVLVDVRELPLSRKKGFSKKALERRLREAGLSYIHMRDLGDPREGRDAARSGDLKKFRQIYLAHFRTEPVRKAFETLLTLGKTKTLCMMCFERDPRVCHRDIIADKMRVCGFAISDLFADGSSQHERPIVKLPGGYSYQSASAAE